MKKLIDELMEPYYPIISALTISLPCITLLILLESCSNHGHTFTGKTKKTPIPQHCIAIPPGSGHIFILIKDGVIVSNEYWKNDHDHD